MLTCDFLIIGLPRCRTAWLSQLFTVSDVFCWHDLSGLCATPEGIQDIISKTPAAFVGLADTGIQLLAGRLAPKRVAYIRRDLAASARALAFAAEVSEAAALEAVHALDMKLWECAEALPGLMLQSSELQHRKCVEDLWCHLVPDRPFPVHRYLQIKNLNVQITHRHLREVARGGGPSLLVS